MVWAIERALGDDEVDGGADFQAQPPVGVAGPAALRGAAAQVAGDVLPPDHRIEQAQHEEAEIVGAHGAHNTT